MVLYLGSAAEKNRRRSCCLTNLDCVDNVVLQLITPKPGGNVWAWQTSSGPRCAFFLFWRLILLETKYAFFFATIQDANVNQLRISRT